MGTGGFISDNLIGGIPTVDMTQIDGVTYNVTLPGAGQEQLYFKTDKLLYAKDSGGVEYLIGGGSTLNTNVYRVPAAVVSTSNVNTASPGATIDGYSLSSGDRVLLVGQSTGSQNGLWTWNGAAVAMTRAGDYLSGSTTLAVTGMTVYIVNGTLGAGQAWRLTTVGAITIDTTTTAWAINGAAIYDSQFTLEDNADPTKQLRFQLSSIATGTLRTLTAPDASGTIALTSTPGTGYVMTAPTASADNLITAATATIRPLAIKTSDDNTAQNMLEFLSSANAVVAAVNPIGHVAFGGVSLSTNQVIRAGKSFTDPTATVMAVNGNPTITLTGNNAQTLIGVQAAITVNPGGFDYSGVASALSGTAQMNSSGTISGTLAGLSFTMQNLSTGTITTANSVDIGSAINSGGGTITTHTALNIRNQTVAGTNNAIVTGRGNVNFGDKVAITGWQDVVQLQVTGNATQTSVLQSWRNSTPTIVASISNLGHAAFGQASAPSANFVIATSKSFADIASTTVGVDSQLTFTYTSPNAQVGEAIRGIVFVNQTGGNVTSGCIAASADARATGSTNTVTGLYGAQYIVRNNGAGTLTNGYGAYIQSAINNGGGTFANNYGLFIESQTAGGTINRAIKTNTGLLEFGDNASFAGTTPTTTDVIIFSKTYADPAGLVTGINSTLIGTFAAGANGNAVQTGRFVVSISLAANNYTGSGSAIRGIAQTIGGANTASNIYGGSFAVNNTGTGTITSAAGISIDSLTNTGGGTITTAYGILINDQTVGSTNYAIWAGTGRVSLIGSQTIASGASATWKGIEFRAATATITGSTNITTATGFNYATFAQPTLSAASALTVTNAATVYIANSPLGAGAGPATITNPYSLWVDDGVTRFDGEALGNSMQDNTIPDTNQTIFSNYSMVVAGPYAINSGITITVASGATLMVL